MIRHNQSPDRLVQIGRMEKLYLGGLSLGAQASALPPGIWHVPLNSPRGVETVQVSPVLLPSHAENASGGGPRLSCPPL